MKYLSVCSGIEAASVAWNSLGWSPMGFSEIEKFPSAVLDHHYPEVENYGDMQRFREWGISPESVNLLVGGTPCQSYSTAGLRRGLRDPRGNLTLVFLAMVESYQPEWVVWENVRGVLSDKTNAFGKLVGGLSQLGYDSAWRVLDAQYFGVPQRRKRVFLVSSPRTRGVHPAKVLFEPESLCRDLTPSREEGEGAAPTLAKSVRTGSGGIDREDMHTLTPSLASSLETTSNDYSRSDQFNMIPVAFDEAQVTSPGNRSKPEPGKPSPTICVDGKSPSLAYQATGNDGVYASGDTSPPLDTSTDQSGICINRIMKVRRLTPRECERLQGFPDDYTLITEKTPDLPRVRALGNSMAVPVMKWIGERIALANG